MIYPVQYPAGYFDSPYEDKPFGKCPHFWAECYKCGGKKVHFTVEIQYPADGSEECEGFADDQLCSCREDE